MKIINDMTEDYHIHSLNYSDGLNTIDEIVKYAGEIGLRKIAITDHSQATLDHFDVAKKCFRISVENSYWENVLNDVEVRFGIEADLLDEKGNVCAEISGRTSDFLILSYHKEIYKGDHEKVADGFIRAMDRYENKFAFIGHVCLNIDDASAARIIDESNKRNIPLELNAAYFVRAPDRWDVLFRKADRAYFNSDSHTLGQLKNRKRLAYDIMKERGWL